MINIFTRNVLVNNPGNARGVWSDGSHVFAADLTSIIAYKKVGASLVAVDSITTANAIGVIGDGTYIFAAEGANGLSVYSGFTCTAAYLPDAEQENFSQVTINQTATADDTLENNALSQTLASDEALDETGIAFVINDNPKISSVPQAAITEIREDSAGATGLVLKTQDSNGNLNDNAYLASSGFLGLNTPIGDPAALFATLQIDEHGEGSWNSDFEKGLLATNPDTAKSLSYFGFEDDGTDTSSILFSQNLKIKRTAGDGSGRIEALRFEQSGATRFFSDMFATQESGSASINNKSYSGTGANGGNIDFRRSQTPSDGTTGIVNDFDTIGQIEFNPFNGQEFANQNTKITAQVDGTPASNDIPTSLTLETLRSNFDYKAPDCAASNNGPFTLVASDPTPITTVTVQDGYIYVGDTINAELRIYTFDGAALNLITTQSILQINDIWIENNIIYVGRQNGTSGFEKYSFNGVTLTSLPSYNAPNTSSIWVKDGYIFTASIDSIYVLKDDGSAVSFVTSINLGDDAISVRADDDYVYASTVNDKYVLSFDGTSLTQIHSMARIGFIRPGLNTD